MFNRVLIANRGEISCRAIRTLKRLNITSIVIYSDIDRNTCHVKEADIAIAIGGNKASESYLRIDKIISAAKKSCAEAIWPGYGFLSESLPFINACEKAGIIFIGPTAQQIEDFGLKHRARELAHISKIPTVPGTQILNSLEESLKAAKIIGYPVMLKSTAGGGGIGLKRCVNESNLRNEWENVRHLGEQFFGNNKVFIERCIDHSKHIEVQIFGDGKGKVISLGERDCSLQRRNQKVVEETPAPNLPQKTRDTMLKAAIRLGEQVKYRSAGTVEYIYESEQDRFYFLEVNTRLQVEHPVTECVTNIDLVEYMLKVAAGDYIDWETLQKKPHGSSIEVRIYAENPIKNFRPSPGTITNFNFPKNIRVDSGITNGSEVSSFYDPILAKLIIHADKREIAINNLQQALANTQLHGIANNLDYLRQIIDTDVFKKGNIWTQFLEKFIPNIQVIEVIHPGTFSSIQDFPGRLGYWNIGIPPSGPMDDFAFRIANRLVGNHERAAGFEFTLVGPSLRFHSNTVIALTGAYCPADINGQEISYWQPIMIKSGDTLKIGCAQSGCRTYLAVRNGIDVPEYLGSRSTFPFGKFGGHGGRILQISDILPISQIQLPVCTTPAPISEPQFIDPELIPSYKNTWSIAVLSGPHSAPDFFTQSAINEFLINKWKVHHNSNRLGIRLIGPKPKWARKNGGEAGLHPSNIHDCEYAIGSINFTGDFPVILTRDGPSLGGFVCPFTIAKAEMWKIGQVKPGDYINFYLIDINQALQLEKNQEYNISTLSNKKILSIHIPNLTHISRLNTSVLVILPASTTTPAVTYRQAGDKYILIEYGNNKLDLALRLRVYLLMNLIHKNKIYGIEELSPGVSSLQIRYDNLIINQRHLVNLLIKIEDKIGDVSTLQIPSRIIWLPMTFEDSVTLETVERYQKTICKRAPWLPNNVDFIQRINGFKNRNIVHDIIFNAKYLVLGLGDVYLGAPCAIPLDPRHRLLSSKYNPARNFTAEGTVGIGGMYMCIYGMDSPGGYQLVGRTLPIWNNFLKNKQFNKKPWLFEFFDQIRFYPVPEKILMQLREDFLEGRAYICIEKTQFDFAAYKKFINDNNDSIIKFQKNQSVAFRKEIDFWKENEISEIYEIQQTSSIKNSVQANKIIMTDKILPVYADTYGNIWKILVHSGDIVKQDQILIIIEAMKMELSIVSPYHGIIKSIECNVGNLINPGDPLLWIEIK